MKVEHKQPEFINVIRFLASGKTGASSEAMAFCAMGATPEDECDRTAHPHDPADFNRCLRLIDYAPEVRAAFPKIAALSPVWAALIERWDEIEACFVDEAGFEWRKAQSAERTYNLMRSIIKEAETV